LNHSTYWRWRQETVKHLSYRCLKLPAIRHIRREMEEEAVEGRKQAISIRLNAADVRNLRKLARRMGVRNSDVVRLALKSCIARLEPLLQPEVKGRDLVPVFVEAGADMVRYLDLDATRIDAIINDGVVDGNKVERADIHLLAGTGMPHSYARMRSVGAAGLRGTPSLSPGDEDVILSQSLHRYFYDKYMHEIAPNAGAAREAGGGQQS
jgi:hypothetical protein